MENQEMKLRPPISPGEIIPHTSDGEGVSPDVGIEVGLWVGTSLYIGEVSKETLAENDITVPFAGWWVCVMTKDELRPVALTCQGPDGDEATVLADTVSRAIRRAYQRGRRDEAAERDCNPPAASSFAAAINRRLSALLAHKGGASVIASAPTTPPPPKSRR